LEKRAQGLKKFLRSQKLALFLFLSVALLAIYGTFVTPERAEAYFGTHFGGRFLTLGRLLGLTGTYHSPLFIALFLLLLLNLVLCTWRRFSTSGKSPDGGSRGWGRPIVRWLDLLMHLSVLVILAGGAAKGMWGFTGTVNIPVTVSADRVFDWRTRTEVPLGFTIQVKNRIDEYYPVQVKIGVRDAVTGERVGLLEMREGSEAELPGGKGRMKVLGFDRQAQVVRLAVGYAGDTEVVQLETREGGENSAEAGPFEVVLVAWRQDLKTVRSLVAILDGERVVQEGWLEPNGRMTFGRTNLFQTAWGVDQYRNPFSGIQVVKDPGAPLFWAGCVLFSLAAPLFLVVRHGRERSGRRQRIPVQARHAWKGKLVLCLSSTLVALLVAEGAVRILDLGPKRYAKRRTEPKGFIELINHPDGLFLYPPDSTFSLIYDPAGDERGYFGPEGRVDFRINGHGLRGPEVPLEKAPETLRVLVLGDSITFGDGVRYEDTYPARLEELLGSRMSGKKVQVVNAGVQAYGTRHAVALFRSRAMAFDPDVVILGFYLNDATDMEETIRHFEARLKGIEVPFPARVSRLWEILHITLHARRIEREFLSVTRASFQGPEWEHIKGLFREMRELSEEKDFRFLVAIFPVLTRLDDDYPLADIHGLVADALNRAGAEYIDLFDVFRGLPADSLWVHPTDHHPNEIAHRIAAERIAAHLEGER
jgi:lysophospholipase L1-like esterase